MPYFVAGGNGNWSSSTNWSATSGGPPGTPPPSGFGTAIIDQNSPGIINITTAASCGELNMSAATSGRGLWIQGGGSLTVIGDILMGGGTILNSGGGIIFDTYQSHVSCNGKSLGKVTINGGADVVADDVFRATSVDLNVGTLDLTGRTGCVISGGFATGAGTKTLILTDATLSIAQINNTNPTGLTVTALGSTHDVTITGTNGTHALGSTVWGANFTFTGGAAGSTTTVTGTGSVSTLTIGLNSGTTFAFGPSCTLTCQTFTASGVSRTITWGTGASLTITSSAAGAVVLSGASKAAKLTLTGSGSGADAMIISQFGGIITVNYADVGGVWVSASTPPGEWTATNSTQSATNGGWTSFETPLDISNALGLSDSIVGIAAQAGSDWTAAPSDNLGIVDRGEATATQLERLSLTDTMIAANGVQYGGSASNSVGITDSRTTALVAGRSRSDLAVLTDTVTYRTTGSLTLADTLAFTDTKTVVQALARSQGDITSLTDAVVYVKQGNDRFPNDSLAIADIASAVQDLLRGNFSQVSLGDSIRATVLSPSEGGGASLGDQFLWANPQVLVNAGYDEGPAVSGVVQASWLLWALSGRRLHTSGNKRDTFEMVPGGRFKINLSTTPVAAVSSVSGIDVWANPSTPVEFDADRWRLVGNSVRFLQYRWFTATGGWVRAADPRLMPVDTLIVVEYTVRDNLPPGTDQVVLLLAEEYCKAAAGLPCKLPDRMTTVTRQGISWTVLDPADFLDRGRTGIIRVDTWLSGVNPGRNRSKARIFDPAMPRLIESQWLWQPYQHLIIDSTGVDTFTGHGPPPESIPGAAPGDIYIDLDTNQSYTLT